MENVVTKRRNNISSDEEERRRMGYESIKGMQFARTGGTSSVRLASVEVDGRQVIRLSCGHTAAHWRINLGFRRRMDKEQLGFNLDTERGYSAPNEPNPDDDAVPLTPAIKRVIPVVEDRRKALPIEPMPVLEENSMASIQAAIKNAIQVEFELEDNELAAEPLPNRDTRHLILRMSQRSVVQVCSDSWCLTRV